MTSTSIPSNLISVSFLVSQNDSPLRSSVSDALSEYGHWNRKGHYQNVDASLRAEGVDVACFHDPWNDAVKETEGNDILKVCSVGCSKRACGFKLLTFRPLTYQFWYQIVSMYHVFAYRADSKDLKMLVKW